MLPLYQKRCREGLALEPVNEQTVPSGFLAHANACFDFLAWNPCLALSTMHTADPALKAFAINEFQL